MIEITKTQSFLCTWNDGEKVEVHTRKSLEEHYGDTNLFDEGENCKEWFPTNGYWEEPWNNLASLLNFMSCSQYRMSSFFMSCTFICDNMTIQRIK